MKDLGHPELYPSSVSCGVTRSKSAPATHCGGCNQCIDRRFAAYAAGLDGYDDTALYERDFLREGMEDDNKHKSLLDFLRQAGHFKNSTVDEFSDAHINGLVELFGYLPEVAESDELETIDRVHTLCRRHGEQVWQAYQRMRLIHEDPSRPPPAGSVFDMVRAGEHFVPSFSATPFIDQLAAIKPGKKQAKEYEALMEEVLPALFSPDLTDPKRQVANATRKGITDLTLRIQSHNGLWSHVAQSYGNLAVSFELKNKGRLKNEDFNQSASRLSPLKGRFGVLVGRRVQEYDQEACRPWISNGMVVLPIEDEDVIAMLRLKEQGESPSDYLAEKLRELLDRIG